MRATTGPGSIITILCLLAAAHAPNTAAAQTAGEASQLLPPLSKKGLDVTLYGGWSSFAHGPINDAIQYDNSLFLTLPAESGGIGLEEGLSQINDALTVGLEFQWGLSPHLSLVAGAERLYDSSGVNFETDISGSGTVSGSFKYEVQALPVYAGLSRTFPFIGNLKYRLALMALYFHKSQLNVDGEMTSGAGSTFFQEEGTKSGIGAMLSWGGEMKVAQKFTIRADIRLRMANIGDPVRSDGTVIESALPAPIENFPLSLDWSGVDILIGFSYTIF